jgi:hypothetical protein
MHVLVDCPLLVELRKQTLGEDWRQLQQRHKDAGRMEEECTRQAGAVADR